MPWSAEQREWRRRNAVEHNLGQNLRPGYQGEWWSESELALLGTAPDEEIASRIGRTARAVRTMRT